MDSVDVKILRCLRENARQNASSIGAKVKLSVSAVIERIRKLEAAGIIRQYTVLLDHKQTGCDTTAFIEVRMEHPKFNDGFVQFMRKNPCVAECHYLTGDFDYILKVACNSTEQLALLLGEIKSVRGVSLTKTMLILSEEKIVSAILPETANQG